MENNSRYPGSRILMWGSLIIVAILFYTYSVRPFMEKQRIVKSQIGKYEKILGRYKKTMDKKDQIESDATTIAKKIIAIESRFLRGDSPAIAASDLQITLKDMGKKSGLDFISERVDKPVEMESYLEIPIAVSFRASTVKLRDFLFKIETHPLLFAIPEMTLRLMDYNNPEYVQVDVKISGFMRKDERITDRGKGA